MDRSPSPSSRPAAPAVVRWGIGDFLWIWFAGLVVATVLGSIGHGISSDTAKNASALTTALAAGGQYGTWLIAMVYVSRTKGRGSLHADFGLTVHAKDWWALGTGVALLFVFSVMVLPIRLLAGGEDQEVVDQLKHAQSAKLVVLLVVAGVLAPFCEELLFRGVLQRALRRRMEPVFAIGIAALAFALAHPLLDPRLGTFALVPALFALGVVSGVAAERNGDLSMSILLHAGFNIATLVSLVASR